MSEFEKKSQLRKHLQSTGEAPEWYSTQSLLMFERKYAYGGETPKGAFERVANTLSKHYTENIELAKEKFFDIMWKGFLAPSTPVLCNTGTNRGLPVSCAGHYTDDSVLGFYDSYRETAVLSQEGFGTSTYLGDIRPRGSKISRGGEADGVVPVIDSIIDTTKKISQGHCYSEDTQVLTDLGFQYFRDIVGTDTKVAQVNQEGVISFVTPNEWISKPYKGRMCHIKDSKNLDILVTPNHDMVVKDFARVSRKKDSEGNYINGGKEIRNGWRKKKADGFKGYRNLYMMHSGLSPSSADNLSSLDKLRVAFQADGSFVKTSSVAIRFRFKKERKILRLESILKDLDFSYNKRQCPDGAATFYVSVPDASFFEKDLEWVDLSVVTQGWGEEFLEEVSLWDGTIISDTAFTYSSIEESCVNKVQEVCAMTGYKSRKSITGNRRGNRQDLHRITCSKGQLFGCDKLVANNVDYEGQVYCATVPEGSLVVARNGHTLVCGNSRRGQCATYLPLDHGDFWELAGYIQKNPASVNIGWMFSEEVIQKLQEGDEEMVNRFNRVMYLRCRTGKGYIWKQDTANRLSPKAVKNSNISIKASNLCSEISLPQDISHSFSCVLSSLNLKYWDHFEEDTIFWAIAFLDCVAEEMLVKARGKKGLEKVVNFTEKSRALGLGTMGFHTYLQDKNVGFDSLHAQIYNNIIFSELQKKCQEASEKLATVYGEPEWCKGTGMRNATLNAVAPNLSSALLAGGVSQGIEPLVSNCFNQQSAAGEMTRINPKLLALMKERGVYTQELVDDLAITYEGSVQHVDWLADDEKKVFKTAYEVNQEVLVRMASNRQRFIDQGQSLNLFFKADEDEKYIAEIHKQILLDPYIKGAYYLRSSRGIKASTGKVEPVSCESCEG